MVWTYNLDQNPADVPERPVDRIFGGRREAIASATCRFCGGDADEFRDELSVKDYNITGMCQTCQDGFYE